MAAAALLLCLFSAHSAEAALVAFDAQFEKQGPNGGSDVTVSLTGQSGTFQLSQGGAMDWTFQQGTNADGSTTTVNPFEGIDGTVNTVSNSFVSFCVEVSQDIGFGATYTYTLGTLDHAPQPGNPPFNNANGLGGMGTTAAMEIAQLWNHYVPMIPGGTDTGNHAGLGESSLAAAFQLAVWKLEYDQSQVSATFSTSGFTSGNIRATESGGSAILTEAASMVDWVAQHPFSAEANLVALISSTAQDQIAALPGTFPPPKSNQPVPEPTTAALCLIGCVCWGASRLRRSGLA